MRRALIVMMMVGLMAVTVAAQAMDKPNIGVPRNGDALGPNYDVSGSMPYKAFLVVMTDAIRADTGEVLRSVPGIRHWTEANGTFRFRCASPRISVGDKNVALVYRVRVFEVSPDGQRGPEAVVTCRMAQ